MLHLAQVQQNENVGRVKLQLLARQQSDNRWAVINPESEILTNTNSFSESCLVLVELSETQEVLSIEPAKDWIVELIRDYLIFGITPNELKEEIQRVEEGLRQLTLQSQDLTRQRLEMEARRENIQALEQQLIQQLEEAREQLRITEQRREQANQELNDLKEQLKAKDTKIQELQQKIDSE